VDVHSAGFDKTPGVYNNIHPVTAAYTDLVEALGQVFEPSSSRFTLSSVAAPQPFPAGAA
jgi:hypothetical protein